MKNACLERSSFLEVFDKKFIPLDSVEELSISLKKQGKTIATLNGSFDLLHAGHLHIIHEASKQADILIVALNSDESIRAYKSPDRPIIPLESRLQMLAALGFVDYVTSFEETTPFSFLEKVKPNVHVNGADYTEDCIEAPIVKAHGGSIHMVNLIDGLSTSNIITKIKKLCD
jgi:D-glycero-beta-D-manno-heptose 1-phosphate adenylyltransferase